MPNKIVLNNLRNRFVSGYRNLNSIENFLVWSKNVLVKMINRL